MLSMGDWPAVLVYAEHGCDCPSCGVYVPKGSYMAKLDDGTLCCCSSCIIQVLTGPADDDFDDDEDYP